MPSGFFYKGSCFWDGYFVKSSFFVKGCPLVKSGHLAKHYSEDVLFARDGSLAMGGFFNQ